MTLGLRDTPKSYFDSLLEQRPWLVLSMCRLEFVSLIKISGELTISCGLDSCVTNIEYFLGWSYTLLKDQFEQEN